MAWQTTAPNGSVDLALTTTTQSPHPKQPLSKMESQMLDSRLTSGESVGCTLREGLVKRKPRLADRLEGEKDKTEAATKGEEEPVTTDDEQDDYGGLQQQATKGESKDVSVAAEGIEKKVRVPKFKVFRKIFL